MRISDWSSDVCSSDLLIADDAVDVSRRRRFIIGRAPRLLRGFLEARSLGILNIVQLYGAHSIASHCKLDLVLRLEAPRVVRDSGMERLGGRRSRDRKSTRLNSSH